MPLLQIILVVAAAWCGLAVVVCVLWWRIRKVERDYLARHPDEAEPDEGLR
jgi:Flp pilus assembly protein CpaB